VHGYAAIDYDTVWRLIEDKLPEQQTNLRMLLGAGDPLAGPGSMTSEIVEIRCPGGR